MIRIIYIGEEYTLYNEIYSNLDTSIHDTKIRYFGKKNSLNYGFYYADENTSKGVRMLADSFINKQNMDNLSKGILIGPRDSLSMRYFDNGGNIEKEVYVTKPYQKDFNNPFSYQDSLSIYYDNSLKWTKFSLSTYLDSLSRSKVRKLVFHFNNQKPGTLALKSPEIKIIFEIQEKPVSNIMWVKAFFDKLKKDYLIHKQ